MRRFVVAILLASATAIAACEVMLYGPYRREKEELRAEIEAISGIEVVDFWDSNEEDDLSVEVYVELSAGGHRIEFMDLYPESLSCEAPLELWVFDGRFPRCTDTGRLYYPEYFLSIDLCASVGPFDFSLGDLSNLPAIAPRLARTLDAWPADRDNAAVIHRNGQEWRCILEDPIVRSGA
ncbi:MAG: hypothetical protein AAF430_18520 [Myxococcota bacterium]